MRFNSFSFLLVFLPVTVVFWYFLLDNAGVLAAQSWLLAASVLFYGWHAPARLLLLFASIIFNWAIARGFAANVAAKRRAALLKFGIVGNILFLASFKYLNVFFLGLVPFKGLQFHIPDWELPLGISFFTLQQIMYLVDCYQELSPANGLFTHATLVSFFPYVSSGPITTSRVFVPQLSPALKSRDRWTDIAEAITIFAIGLFKKVVLADSFARFADLGFGNTNQLSALEAWVSMLTFTMQLYFDFSGYSDMAVGAALLLGIELPRNFNAPYLARTMTEFWQRWHITLSSFITAYLYTPLMRSFRRATLGTSALAILVAMTIMGLWHGPAWTFVIFGFLHGIGLAINQFWRKAKRPLAAPVAWAATFLYVNIAFVFFRANSVPSAVRLLHRLVVVTQPLDLAVFRTQIRGIEFGPIGAATIIGVVLAFCGPTSDTLQREFAPTVRTACFVTALLLVSCLFLNSNLAKEFFYFAF